MPFTRSLRAKSCLCRSKLTFDPMLPIVRRNMRAAHLDVQPHLPRLALVRAMQGTGLVSLNGEVLASRCNRSKSGAHRVGGREEVHENDN